MVKEKAAAQDAQLQALSSQLFFFFYYFFFTSTIILRKRKSFHGRVVQMHIFHNLQVRTTAELQLAVQSMEEHISY